MGWQDEWCARTSDVVVWCGGGEAPAGRVGAVWFAVRAGTLGMAPAGRCTWTSHVRAGFITRWGPCTPDPDPGSRAVAMLDPDPDPEPGSSTVAMPDPDPGSSAVAGGSGSGPGCPAGPVAAAPPPSTTASAVPRPGPGPSTRDPGPCLTAAAGRRLVAAAASGSTTSMPSSCACERIQDSAICADSSSTSPSWPVRVSWPGLNGGGGGQRAS